MYIEFQLPKIDGGYTANIALTHINIDIDDWVRKYNIHYHKTKLHKYTYRLCLADERAYSHFAISWQPKYNASKQFIFKNPK